jgi:hypothetical protein
VLKLWSKIAKIWLLAVTAVVFTVTSVPEAGIITDPAAAAAHTAGPAEEEQLVAVRYLIVLSDAEPEMVLVEPNVIPEPLTTTSSNEV